MIKFCCYLIVKYLWGWKFKYSLDPKHKSYVVLGCPHTSNWDFLIGMSFIHKLNLNTRFIIKSEWMKFPLSLIFSAMGAIGVNREKVSASKNMSTTDLWATLFQEHKDLCIMISPEGTRSANDHWKTGFYYLAQKANVPIALGYGDWKTKTVGVGKIIYPTDFDKDMKEICDFYATKGGKIQSKFKVDKRFLS